MKARRAIALIVSLFFMWGFITVLVDALIPRLKEVFELTYLQAGLVQFAWFTAYGVLGIPGGLLLKRIGYKNGILVGLTVCGLGCLLFYPAAATRMYALFLLALFVVAGGITILQVAANPYISVLGKPEFASSRLNLAQAFNSLGTTIAPIVAASFLLSDTILTGEAQAALSPEALEAYRVNEASAVQQPFVFLALAFGAIALMIGVSKLPKILDPSGGGLHADVIKNRKLMFGAIGIFVYVGAEVAIGSYMVNYGLDLGISDAVQENSALSAMIAFAAKIKGTTIEGMDPRGMIGALLTFYWGGAMIGRFVGSYLTQVFKPNRVLGTFGIIAILLILASVLSSGVPALLFLLAVGLFNSIMFPTIFTIAIEDLGDAKPQGSGILCTAIVGGAFIPPAVGALADSYGFSIAFLLPLVCYLYIMLFAFGEKKLGISHA